MSDPSPVWLVFNWFAYGAIVTSVAFSSDAIVLEVIRFLGLESTSLALLTFLLITVVFQAAIWWLNVAARTRHSDSSH